MPLRCHRDNPGPTDCFLLKGSTSEWGRICYLEREREREREGERERERERAKVIGITELISMLGDLSFIFKFYSGIYFFLFIFLVIFILNTIRYQCGPNDLFTIMTAGNNTMAAKLDNLSFSLTLSLYIYVQVYTHIFLKSPLFFDIIVTQQDSYYINTLKMF